MPCTQVPPAGQTLPQEPQLLLSLFTETQTPLHDSVPMSQPQLKLEQTWVGPQRRPQPPQLL